MLTASQVVVATSCMASACGSTRVIALKESANQHFQAPQHRVVLQVQNECERDSGGQIMSLHEATRCTAHFLLGSFCELKHLLSMANGPNGLFGWTM